MSPFISPSRISAIPVILAALALAGCLANPSIEQGRQNIAEGRYEDGVRLLDKASREDPADSKLRALSARERLNSASRLSQQGEQERNDGKLEAATLTFKRALDVDPTFARARQGLEQIEADQRHRKLMQDGDAALKRKNFDVAEAMGRAILAQEPGNSEARRLLNAVDQGRLASEIGESNKASAQPLNKPVTLEFRDATLKSVFEVLSRNAGVNFVFDKDVKGDAKVTVFVRNTPMDEVIRLILTTNQLEKQQLNNISYIIYPNTAAKQKEYQELAVRTFYLANAEAKQIQNMLKTVLKIKDVHVDEKLNVVVARDTPNALKLAEKLVQGLDVAEPEVMLELEVLEVNRSRLDELGIRWPSTVSFGSAAAATGSALNLNTSGLRTFAANPFLVADIKGTIDQNNLLANPRIRVRNREKAKVHIGDKLPVFTTTSTANVGVSASVTYLDVGLKLEVEPQIYLEDDVAIKVQLEVSSVVKEVQGPEKSLAYQVGTRSTNTTLRLKNGETQILAGLISDEERSSGSRIPGLGDLPLLGRLFGSQRDTHSKTEIILLVTPRVVRNILPPDWVRGTLPAGTEGMVGTPPLTIKNMGPRSLSISATPGSAAANRPEPAAPVETTPAADSVAAPAAATPASTPPAPDNKSDATPPAATPPAGSAPADSKPAAQ